MICDFDLLCCSELMFTLVAAASIASYFLLAVKFQEGPCLLCAYQPLLKVTTALRREIKPSANICATQFLMIAARWKTARKLLCLLCPCRTTTRRSVARFPKSISWRRYRYEACITWFPGRNSTWSASASVLNVDYATKLIIALLLKHWISCMLLTSIIRFKLQLLFVKF